ncbi:hypothetical protein AB7V73_24815, partial [Escherichia coli]|uniref:hypothetical protein n=1 Tax=Escherichia coli TaxID=562 RepID=UPI0029C0C1D1
KPPAHSPEENMVRQKCSGIRRSYLAGNFDGIDNVFSKKELTEYNTASSYIRRNVLTKKNH